MRDYTPKILIVDDIKENLITLEMNMRILNVDIILAKSGQEALIQVKQNDFALMIIDIQMPVMNGFETTERIRQGRRNRHTPIIFLTAVYHDENSVYKGYQSGAVDYITKPFNREILLSKVRVFLDLDRIKSELTESKQQFQSIVQDQTDLICRTDKDLQVIFANRALLISFAQTFERVKGKKILDWVDQQDLQNFKNSINLLSPTNALVKINHQINLSFSRYMLVTSIIRALFDANFELMGYQLVMRDITSEITSKNDLLEAQKRVTAVSLSRSQFIANMSHEIRTPMNSIIGLLEVLKETGLNEEQTEIFDVVHHSAGNLMSLLNDIIDLSKIDSNKIQFSSNWFALEDLMHKTVKLLELKAKENNSTLKLTLDKYLPKEVNGDALRLGQILINLLTNAIKFTNDGVVELSVENESEDKNRAKIKFTVADTGMGIGEDAIKNIFKIYDQGDPEITRQFGGSGLGLAISNSLCEKMGGKITVKSKVGQGTSFWFTLNFEIKSHQHKPTHKNIHILVVEDNMLNQKVVGTTLKRNGFSFDVADNGQAAFEKFKNNHFNLILMDIQMPLLDGYETTLLIREYEKAHPENPRTKIIALTANATTEDKNKCREIGMDEYLTKPFRFKDLNDIIEKMTK